MNNNIWSTKDVYIEECGKHNYNFVVMLSAKVKHKINVLMKKFPSLEWLAYMSGNIDYRQKQAIIDDLIIPDQEVGVSKVFDIQSVNEKTVGVIHSHHNMGNFFSSDDKETINKNNDISLVVTHQKITGQIRIKTECGCYLNKPVIVKDYIEHSVDTENWLKEIEGRIKPKIVYEEDWVDDDEYDLNGYDNVLDVINNKKEVICYNDLEDREQEFFDSLDPNDRELFENFYNKVR